MESKEKLKKMYDYIMIDNQQGLMDKEEVEALTEDYNSILKTLEFKDTLIKELKYEQNEFGKLLDEYMILQKENRELKQANGALIKTLKIIKQCIENSTNIQELMESIMKNVSKEVLEEVKQDEQS